MRFGIQQQGGRWLVVNELGETLADCGSAAEAIADLRTRMAAAPAGDGRSLGRVRAMLAPEGEYTSDRRFIEEGALTWRDMPLPMMNQTTTEIGHFGAELAGRFTEVERRDNEIWAVGDIDESEAGQELLNILQQHGRYGVSIDMGDMDADIICEDDTDCELRVTRGEIMGATGTPFPAFARAFIELDSPVAPPAEDQGDGEDEAAAASVAAIGAWSHRNGNAFSFINSSMGGADVEPCEECEAEELAASLVAAGIPMRPPAAWFDDPEFDRVTPLAVMADGRVAGHLAPWGECHVGRPGVCVTAPTSSPGYPYFRTGVVLTASGDEVPVGQITLGTGHAGASLPFRAAAEHYDSTGTVIADVSCGEDDHGIWVAGALRPGTTEEQVRQLRAASLSGDWRTVAGRYELVAALAVNVPGFPIPRTHAGMIDGRQVSLVAAGVIPHLEPWQVADLAIHERLDEIATLLQSVNARTRPLALAASAAVSQRVRGGVVPSSD